MKQKNNLKSLDTFVDEQYGLKGTPKRDEFEKGYEGFKLGFLLQQARLKKGMTQEELAQKWEQTRVISRKLRITSRKFVFQHFKRLLSLD